MRSWLDIPLDHPTVWALSCGIGMSLSVVVGIRGDILWFSIVSAIVWNVAWLIGHINRMDGERE